MKGVIARLAAPRQLTADRLAAIDVPVLLILGTKDNLVGDPGAASAQARNIPDIRIEVLESGHLIFMEQINEVNQLISEFLSEHSGI